MTLGSYPQLSGRPPNLPSARDSPGNCSTDRDTVLCDHASEGLRFVPEWVDPWELLGTCPARGCS
jgi:hypothetical protein